MLSVTWQHFRRFEKCLAHDVSLMKVGGGSPGVGLLCGEQVVVRVGVRGVAEVRICNAHRKGSQKVKFDSNMTLCHKANTLYE